MFFRLLIALWIFVGLNQYGTAPVAQSQETDQQYHIYFAANSNGDDTTTQIYRINPDGTGLRPITNFDGGVSSEFAVNNQGELLVRKDGKLYFLSGGETTEVQIQGGATLGVFTLNNDGGLLIAEVTKGDSHYLAYGYGEIVGYLELPSDGPLSLISFSESGENLAWVSLDNTGFEWTLHQYSRETLQFTASEATNSSFYIGWNGEVAYQSTEPTFPLNVRLERWVQEDLTSSFSHDYEVITIDGEHLFGRADYWGWVGIGQVQVVKASEEVYIYQLYQ
jgi:hypothetical protein